MQWNESFKGKIWVYSGPGGWHFVTLPVALSKRLRTLTQGQRRPFGSFRVTAKINSVSWQTSLFADTKRNAFLLPVKADARRRAKLAAGDTAEIEISFEA